MYRLTLFFELCINLVMPLFLVLKMLSRSTEYIQVDFRLDFFMVANNMNSDRLLTREQSDLGPYCLQSRLPKNKSK